MRFLTCVRDGAEIVGVRLATGVVDLSIADPALPRTLLGLIQAGALDAAHETALRAPARAHLPLDAIEFLPLIPRPPKLFGFGVNYRSHVGERPRTPGYFLSGPARLCAHNEPMLIPRKSRTLDYEIELAFVIGKRALRVAAADALSHVAGYTIFNDGSVRGYGGGITLSLMKNSDKTGPLGPELVTPEELPPGADGLTLTTRRNGQIVQRDNTANMYWKVADVIELCSSFLTLEPGDVLTTGTCGGTIADTYCKGGVGMEDEGLPYLRPGEQIECEIEGIGVLRNGVIDDNR